MNANLVFQADLLINAEIMTELKTGNASAQAIVERWDSMTHDAVYLEGAEEVYTASGYFDAVNTRAEQRHIPVLCRVHPNRQCP